MVLEFQMNAAFHSSRCHSANNLHVMISRAGVDLTSTRFVLFVPGHWLPQLHLVAIGIDYPCELAVLM